jgi:hypothetical protein
MTQRLQVFLFVGDRQRAARLGDGEREQRERGELGGVGLGRCDADFRTGARDEPE